MKYELPIRPVHWTPAMAIEAYMKGEPLRIDSAMEARIRASKGIQPKSIRSPLSIRKFLAQKSAEDRKRAAGVAGTAAKQS
jgi:hypothetical protein